MPNEAGPRVAVLAGGLSAEREVSLSSARECAAALREAGYDVTEIDAGRDLPARLEAMRAEGPFTVFNALHGRYGEDGTVQGLLEWMAIPYTHSGVLASAVAMDKARAKDVLAAAGLPVAPHVIAAKDEIAAAHIMEPPYVVKPVDEGSSVGIHIVPAGANRPPVLSADMPGRLMVEAYAEGRELTVSVMGARGEERALGVTDILTDGWYDYDAKYAPGGSRHVIPADIPAAVADRLMEMAVAAHRVLGCRGVSRTDFRWDEPKGEGGIVILEVNTQPGMTPTSLTPEQAAHADIDFPAFCAWLVEDASCGR